MTNYLLGVLTGIVTTIGVYWLFAMYTYYQGFKYSGLPKYKNPPPPPKKHINDIEVVSPEEVVVKK